MYKIYIHIIIFVSLCLGDTENDNSTYVFYFCYFGDLCSEVQKKNSKRQR